MLAHPTVFPLARSTQYFGPTADFKYPSVAATLAQYKQAAVNNTAMTATYAGLKRMFGVKLAAYEAGPGYRVGALGPGKELTVVIEASRDPGMQAIVEYDIESMYFSNGGDIYNYFAAVGEVSRYGCWGAMEFWTDLDRKPLSPKMQAIVQVTGRTPAWPPTARAGPSRTGG